MVTLYVYMVDFISYTSAMTTFPKLKIPLYFPMFQVYFSSVDLLFGKRIEWEYYIY